MDTNATTDDDVKAIKKLGEEFFAGVNAEDLERRMATMDPDVIIMPRLEARMDSLLPFL
jgi:ketosteroid isomerase-like protein